MIANFWLHPGDTASAPNMLSFLKTSQQDLDDTTIGLLQADSGFFANEIRGAFEADGIDYVVAAKLSQPLQARLMSPSCR